MVRRIKIGLIQHIVQPFGVPKSRGVCLATGSINVRQSNLISDILVAVIAGRKRQNVKSTEK